MRLAVTGDACKVGGEAAGVSSTAPPLTEQPPTGKARPMAPESNPKFDGPRQAERSGSARIRDNGAPECWREDTDWIRLGEVVADIRARVDRAIADRDEEAGAAAHDDLISAEWRLRLAERRKA